VVPPAERVLDEMAAAGFAGTELGPHGYLGRDAVEVKTALSARGLRLVGAFCPLPLTDADGGKSALPDAMKLAELLAAVGCDRIVAADAGGDRRRELAGRVAQPHGEWGAAGETLALLAERCRPLGVGVVFHPHAGTNVETESELDGLMAATPPELVGLCLDTGHIAYGGGDSVAVARRYGERVRHVHLKDVSAAVLERVRTEGLGYERAIGEDVFTPLGEGSVDFPTLVQALDGYDGWWVLEQDVRLGPPWSQQDPAQNARRSLAYLKELLK
jgi:inosose dehydratase